MKHMKSFAPFVLVLLTVTDPAIDAKAMNERVKCADGEERALSTIYAATYEEQFLRLKPGAMPLRFTLEPLRQRMVNRLLSDPENPSGDELWHLVAACLSAIEDPSGKLSLGDDDRMKADSEGRRAVTPDAMERIAAHVGIVAIREIGWALIRRASLPEWASAPFVLAGGSEASSSKTG